MISSLKNCWRLTNQEEHINPSPFQGERERERELNPSLHWVTLNNHAPNTLLSRIHVRGIMKADKHNKTRQALYFFFPPMLKKLICFNSIKMHPFHPSSLPLQTPHTHTHTLSLSLFSLNMANLVTSFMLWLCLISYAYTTIHAAPEWPRGRSTRFYDFKVSL
jgi:hypothetical protein